MSQKNITENAVLMHSDETQTPYLSFPSLEQLSFLRHGFSTRLGGVSEGIYASMNLGFGRGDSDENVRENYHRLCSSIGINEHDLVFTHQVHKANIRIATADDKGKGYDLERDYSDIDGMITNEPGVPLLVFCADCVPILLADPVKKAVGAVHSGWKGTVAKISSEAIWLMADTYGSDPSDIIAVVGPCICKDCYEVGSEVAKQFLSAFTKEQCKTILTPHADSDKYQLDLWEANRHILLDAGIKPENLTISGVCTMCHSDLLFSHRATKGERGSNAGFIQII